MCMQGEGIGVYLVYPLGIAVYVVYPVGGMTVPVSSWAKKRWCIRVTHT